MTKIVIGAALAMAMLPSSAVGQIQTAEERTSMQAPTRVEAIDRTWSGHRVSQELIVREGHQIVAYYDANRQLTLAHRNTTATSANPWRFHKLDTWIGWDSHNRPALEVDEQGYIHVMANMHVDQMVYFRSERPWDVRSMKPYDHLVDAAEESRVTYPYFTHDAAGALIAKYRIGSSGDGVEIYNRFDVATKTWRRLHDGPLVDGEGKSNAYFVGPDMGPDGFFHLVWVWRETPSANTNHDLSYARSRDLVNWERSNGAPIKLPIRLRDAEIVDAVPVGGGMLNGQTRLGFDRAKRPMIAYYKRDAAGDHQIFLTALRDGKWRSHQITRWRGFKMDLDRTGSLALPLGITGDPAVGSDGAVHVRVVKQGQAIDIAVDPTTLAPIGETKVDRFPAELARDDVPTGADVQIVPAIGPDGRRWYLSWYAMPSNQDRARATIPAPATLLLYSLPPAKAP